MAKRGDTARQNIKDTIAAAFGENFIGVMDKKLYVEAMDDSGEKIQFSLTVTLTKNPIGREDVDTDSAPVKKDAHDWSDVPVITATKEDEEKISNIMKALGLE